MSGEKPDLIHNLDQDLDQDLASDLSLDARRTADAVIVLQKGIDDLPAAPANALSAPRI